MTTERGAIDRRRPTAEQHQAMFWAKVSIGDSCWDWTAHVNSQGYGTWTIRIDGAQVIYRAHRYMYELMVGPIPDGLTLDHLCHPGDGSCPGGPSCPHRRCVRPDHLKPVPRGENVLRGVGHGALNARKTHCPNNHEYTPENTWRDNRGYRRCRACHRAPFRSSARKIEGEVTP